MPDTSTILVVGDIMIDRSWLVRQPDNVMRRYHGDITALKLRERSAQTGMLGGAGTIARCLIARGAKKVILMGGWSEKLNNTLTTEPSKLVPEMLTFKSPEYKPLDTIKDALECRQIAITPFDTEKVRIYHHIHEGSPLLKNRFDRDLEPESKDNRDYTYNNKVIWPNPDEIAVVIVNDFAKGLLELPEVKNELKKYKDIPFVLRPRSTDVLDLPWTILAPNREDFSRVLPKENNPLPPTVFRRTDGNWGIHPNVLNGLKNLRNVPCKNPALKRSIVLKLDKEGAVLLDKDSKIHPFVLSKDAKGDWAGVSAGDVLISELVIRHIKNFDISEAVHHSVAAATWYCENAESIGPIQENNMQWYGRLLNKPEKLRQMNEDQTTWERNRIVGKDKAPNSIDELLNRYETLLHTHEYNIQQLRDVSISDGYWYLPGFLTIDPIFGLELQKLSKKLKSFVKIQKKVQPHML